MISPQNALKSAQRWGHNDFSAEFMTFPYLLPLGETAWVVTLGTGIDPALNAEVHARATQLRQAQPTGVTAIVPAYATLTIHYQPEILATETARTWIAAQFAQAVSPSFVPARLVTIPVRYGGAFGPDLDFVAHIHGLTPAEVITRHCAPTYRVYLMGFTPGFAYLGGLDETLATPRHATPRAQVSAGSVGIAGAQTGVYPQTSPGGWQIIGRTALRLFDPTQTPPTLLQPGDGVKFVPE